MKINLREVLMGYKTLDLSLNEVQEVFGRRMVFDTDGFNYRVSFNPPLEVDEVGDIAVTSKDFINVLRKFLNGEISIEQLRDWANLIQMIEVYSIGSSEGAEKKEILSDIRNHLDEIGPSFDKNEAKRYLALIQGSQIVNQ